MFLLQSEPLPSAARLCPVGDHAIGGDHALGGVVVFEGRVRDHHQGRRVTALHYEVYEALALAEGERIVAEARARFGVPRVAAAHRYGTLEPGEVAVVVVAASAHRDEAFAACRWVIDRIKERLPVWKREYYDDGTSDWVACGDHGAGCGLEPGGPAPPHPQVTEAP